MTNEVCKSILKRCKYEFLKDTLESGLITETYERKDDSTSYTVDVSFTNNESYIFHYKDSTGGNCNYYTLYEFIVHLLMVHEGFNLNTEKLDTEVEKILSISSDMSQTEFEGSLSMKRIPKNSKKK